MQNIDRWLMWDDSADTPRRPHWKGDFSVSFNDAEDHHTFEKAVGAAAEKDSWGIGFVTGDDIAVIDVDGCADIVEDGRKDPKDWVPSLREFRRAADGSEVYAEWSPSGTGLHIPVADFDEPEFWTDLSIDDAEHEGVDVLQGRFVTVTGDVERGFDGEVVEHAPDIDHWLLGAKETINALNGDGDLANAGDGDGWKPDNEWLTEDDIRDALSHLDADCGYNQWRNIGFAVAEFFHEEDDGGADEDAWEKAVELFKSWSETADEQWDASAEQQAERIVEDSWESIEVESDPVTVGTLIAYATNAGWDMPAPPQSNSEEVDWDAVEEARLSTDWRSDEMCDVRDDVIGEEWTDPPEDSDKEPEFIGLYVSEPIGPDDDVIVTLPKQDARVEHRAPAQSTVDVKLQDRYAGRVINAEPLHKLAQRLDVLYNECLNAQARAAVAHRLMQALEFVTTGGADDQTIYCYNPVTGTLDGDGREVIRSVIEGVCPGRASGHEKREIVGKIADRTREDGSQAFEPRGKFDNEEHDYRVVGNGILRLPTLQRDGSVSDPELLDFDPDLRAKQRLPVDWSPDADTLEIDEWLDEITERPEDRATIEEAIGNILLPDYRHPKITMMYGSGRNSKGVILDVIVEMCGGVDSPTVAGNRLEDLAKNKFRTAMLDDALVNVSGDIGQRKIQEGSKLKELTGGDAQEGESKHEDSETFRNSAKLWFAANSPPLPPESGEAWQERWLPIHLPFQFIPDPDPEDPYQKPQENGIKDRLTRDDNLEAILVRAIEGLARLEAQGDVSLPESPAERLDSYEQDADPIGRVETDLLKPVHGASSKAEKYVPNGAVFDAYKSLASDDGVDAVSRTDFFRLLEDRVEDIPFDKSRPRAPDSVDDDRVYSMTGVAFRDEAVEHLSEYWLNHPWVTIDAPASDDGGESANDTADRRSPHYDDVITLDDAANADSYVTVEVDVDYKNLQGSNLIEITVHDDSAMRDIVAKDRGNDELDIVDGVQEGDTVRFERLKPGADLKVRPMTDVTIVNRENSESVNDEEGDSTRSIDLINDPIDNREGTSASEDAQAEQDAARADGGEDEGDTAQIDRAVREHADAAEDDAALAGQVSAVTKCNDLDEIAARIRAFRDEGSENGDGGSDGCGEFDGEDPPRPATALDTWQCRECGVKWGTDTAWEECGQCGAEVDVDWNVETGRVSSETAEAVNGGEA